VANTRGRIFKKPTREFSSSIKFGDGTCELMLEDLISIKMLNLLLRPIKSQGKNINARPSSGFNSSQTQ
jgi:hypothetical protein